MTVSLTPAQSCRAILPGTLRASANPLPADLSQGERGTRERFALFHVKVNEIFARSWRAVTFFRRDTLLSGLKNRLWALLVCTLIFGSGSSRVDGFELTPKMLEHAEQKYGAPARARLERWHALIHANQDKTVQEKLELVNDFFNELTFVDDSIHWNKVDYWATPIEMMETGGGDCEDFSIAKFFTLLTLGVDESHLRLTYVKALGLNQAHMVLTYFSSPGVEPLVLDNLISAIKPAYLRNDLLPVYSFNGDGLWLAKRRKMSGQMVGGSGSLELWQDLLQRIKDTQP
jgi:predicted transglutaminase-like cysteine proteinase